MQLVASFSKFARIFHYCRWWECKKHRKVLREAYPPIFKPLVTIPTTAILIHTQKQHENLPSICLLILFGFSCFSHFPVDFYFVICLNKLGVNLWGYDYKFDRIIAQFPQKLVIQFLLVSLSSFFCISRGMKLMKFAKKYSALVTMKIILYGPRTFLMRHSILSIMSSAQ